MKKYALTLLCLVPILNGCGDLSSLRDPTKIENTSLKSERFSEMKLISEEIQDSQDKRSLLATTYSIGESSRLLMRNPQILQIEPSMIDLYPILIQFQLVENYSSQDLRELKICPLTKNWMMLATWSKAHPYKNGLWDTEGSDMDYRFCESILDIERINQLPPEERSRCTKETAICFDVRPVIKSAVRESVKNYGFVLINQGQQVISIFGDASFSQPLLFWRGLR